MTPHSHDSQANIPKDERGQMKRERDRALKPTSN